MSEIEERLKALEDKVKFLEERIEMLIEIADSEKRPFTYLALEYGLTKEQIERIYDLMDEVSKAIREGKTFHHSEFEDRIYQIVPQRKGDYHFAEEIVSTLNQEGRWQEVYQHMKKSGMNI